MKIPLRFKTRSNHDVIHIFSLLLVLPPVFRAQNTLDCNEILKNACSCYNFENAVYLDCQDRSVKDIKYALKSITNVHTLSIYDLDDSEDALGPHFIPQGNVIECRCQKNNTWTWIQDHPKIIKPHSVLCFNDEYPKDKCNFPIIAQLSVDKHNDNSVSVSWFIRNRTAIKALQILYYDDAKDTKVHFKYIEKSELSTKIFDLKPNNNYVVCLLTINDEFTPNMDEIEELFQQKNFNDSATNTTTKLDRNFAATLIAQSPSSECITFDTLRKASTIKKKSSKDTKHSSIFNRRTGLIVGCCLGFVVFFVMVSVLLYTKFKERKRIEKSDPAWSEMNDYHSVHSKEDILNSTTASTDNILLGITKNRNTSIVENK
ncbi:uncharacterized protein LOC121727092 isoform X2 [Aricia agestis]|uniref:uncharacterized protein LOC121727092 isoform X2 n=1 Tax=Aricia agestis TaxID=91739 RepID=UPI001C2047EE|nr:uncharacterized protein LOC121727092 isoform X2 [Aricia agestis]